jgi:hypothetical protein
LFYLGWARLVLYVFKATLKKYFFAQSLGVSAYLVMLKFYPSEVTADSEINFMPAVSFLTCLGVGAYLILHEISTFSRYP